MNVVITPGRLSGSVRTPASKSAAHRLMICSALADRPTHVRLSATSRDIKATADCLRALGARIQLDGDVLHVDPIDQVPGTALLDCGESGSTLRFLLPERPNQALTDSLRKHGAAIDSDLLPLNVSGSLSGGLWELPGNISSQYITGLLLALPLLEEDSRIVLTTPLESASYVDMTLHAIGQFGVTAERAGVGWRIPGRQRYRSPGEVEVEGDWSSAAFWLAANALGADIRIDGLADDSVQGDRVFARLLGQPAIDASGIPDLVPALAVAAASLPHRTVVTGAARLRLKESDRLQTVADLLTALGHGVDVTPDGLVIYGGAPAPCDLRLRTVNGANDHRIVMAAAVAAAFADRPVRITGAEAVEKSYPGFFRDFGALGGNIYVERAGQ